MFVGWNPNARVSRAYVRKRPYGRKVEKAVRPSLKDPHTGLMKKGLKK